MVEIAFALYVTWILPHDQNIRLNTLRTNAKTLCGQTTYTSIYWLNVYILQNCP